MYSIENHILYKVFPCYFQYPPGTIHSYYNIIDYICYVAFYIPITILELPVYTSESLHLLHSVCQPYSPLTAISLSPVSTSLFQFCEIVQYVSFSDSFSSFTIIPSRSIYANVRFHSFLWPSNIPLYICVAQLFYPIIYWWTLGLVSCLGYCKLHCREHRVNIFVWISVLVFFRYILRSRITRSLSSSIFNFSIIPTLFSLWPHQSAFPPTVHEGFLVSTFLPQPVICGFSDGSHFDRFKVISHYSKTILKYCLL